MGSMRKPTSALVLVTLACATTAGCTLPVRANEGEPAKPYPVLTTKQAREVLRTYVRKNNKANAKRDTGLLNTIEGGSSYVMDKKRYAIDAYLDPKNKNPIGRFHYVDPTFYIPRIRGYPRWFAVQATSKDKDGKAKRPTLLVFVQHRAGTLWEQVFAVRMSEGKKLPELAVENVPVIDAPDSRRARRKSVTEQRSSRVPARRVAELHVRYLKKGAKSRPDRRFASSETMSTILTERRKTRKEYKKAGRVFNSFGVSRYPVRTLRTVEGGSLVLYTLWHRFRGKVGDGWSIELKGRLRALATQDSLLGKLDVRELNQWIAYVPPEKGAKIRLLGLDSGLVSVSGGV